MRLLWWQRAAVRNGRHGSSVSGTSWSRRSLVSVFVSVVAARIRACCVVRVSRWPCDGASRRSAVALARSARSAAGFGNAAPRRPAPPAAARRPRRVSRHEELSCVINIFEFCQYNVVMCTCRPVS